MVRVHGREVLDPVAQPQWRTPLHEIRFNHTQTVGIMNHEQRVEARRKDGPHRGTGGG
jgi:hypothetical protein